MTPSRSLAGLLGSAVIALALTASIPAPAQAQVRLPESQIKAAFLYNLVKFVRWPLSDGASDRLAICVIGSRHFSGVVDRVIRGRSVQGREIVVRALDVGDDVLACQIAFLSASDPEDTAAMLTTVEASVLTVGETPDFLRAGGHVRFFVENNHVRVEIDSIRADRAGLKIDSQLLSLARR